MLALDTASRAVSRPTRNCLHSSLVALPNQRFTPIRKRGRFNGLLARQASTIPSRTSTPNALARNAGIRRLTGEKRAASVVMKWGAFGKKATPWNECPIRMRNIRPKNYSNDPRNEGTR